MAGRGSRWRICGVFVAILCVAAGALSACAGSSGGGGAQSIRFVWWGNEDRANATKKAVELFQQRNPGITVQTEFSGYAAYVQKLSTQVAGGAAPDLIQLDRPTFGEYQQKRVLTELDQYAGTVRVDRIPDNLLAGGKVAGKQYAVPGGQTAQMVAYDSDLFAKAGVAAPEKGWTWQEFSTAMTRVAASTGVPGSGDFGWAIDWFDSWLHQHGKQAYTTDGKLGFTAADLEQFWNLTGSLRRDKGLSPPEATTKMDGSIQNSSMIGKQAASEWGYDSGLTSYLTTYQGPVKVAPLPSDGTTAQDSGMAALPPVYFAVPQRSGHKDAAVKLLDFLVNDPEAGKILGTTRGLPANADIRTAVCAAASGNEKAVCDYAQAVSGKLGTSQGWLWPSGSSAIKTNFQQVYDDVIFGKASVAEAAQRVVRDAEQSLGS
jgi:multiple sugar transport system substrate-binding protein